MPGTVKCVCVGGGGVEHTCVFVQGIEVYLFFCLVWYLDYVEWVCVSLFVLVCVFVCTHTHDSRFLYSSKSKLVLGLFGTREKRY